MSSENKPYHHLSDGTFRNPEGSPERNTNFKWSFKVFNKEKKKLDMTIPDEHVVSKENVLSNLTKFKDENYIVWIGHATFIIIVYKEFHTQYSNITQFFCNFFCSIGCFNKVFFFDICRNF